jgi:hypothetical protein
VEGPAIENIYRLLKAQEKLRYARFNFNHNYNQTSREAVYQWFDKWLLNHPDAPVSELTYQKEPDAALRVFPDGQLPPDAISQDGLIKCLIKDRQSQLQKLEPKDRAGWQRYREIMEPAWKRTLQLEYPKAATHTAQTFIKKTPNFSAEWLEVNRVGETTKLKLLHFTPATTNAAPWTTMVLLADPRGKSAYCNESGEPIGLARQLLDCKLEIAIVESFPSLPAIDQLSIFYTTYNRTYLQERVRDLITLCHGVGNYRLNSTRVVLCGAGRAGLWALLAAPAANGTVADCDQLDLVDDKSLLSPDLFCPGLRNIDTFSGAALLAAPKPLRLHNVASTFSTEKIKSAYHVFAAAKQFNIDHNRLPDAGIAEWITKLADQK